MDSDVRAHVEMADHPLGLGVVGHLDIAQNIWPPTTSPV